MVESLCGSKAGSSSAEGEKGGHVFLGGGEEFGGIRHVFPARHLACLPLPADGVQGHSVGGWEGMGGEGEREEGGKGEREGWMG